MDSVPPQISKDLRLRLDTATPTNRDYCLYCAACGFIGETNSCFMADHNPPCSGKLRIWRHTP